MTSAVTSSRFPLSGIRVLELAGLAPAPFCGMVLADFGAQVTRVNRVGEYNSSDVLSRGKKSISVNLKTENGKSVFKRLSKLSDVIIEPFRPGVMERLELCPKTLCQQNEKLIYVRLNGKCNCTIFNVNMQLYTIEIKFQSFVTLIQLSI